MTITLTPELEAIVASKVASGRFQNAVEVVNEALRVFEERENGRKNDLNELLQEISIGLDQLERGETVDGEEVFRELEERSRRRRSQG